MASENVHKPAKQVIHHVVDIGLRPLFSLAAPVHKHVLGRRNVYAAHVEPTLRVGVPQVLAQGMGLRNADIYNLQDVAVAHSHSRRASAHSMCACRLLGLVNVGSGVFRVAATGILGSRIEYPVQIIKHFLGRLRHLGS